MANVNVNSINQISECHGLGGLRSSIQYACVNDEPHNSDHGQIKHRSLAICGLNCSDNPYLAYQSMRAILNKAYCTPVSVTGIRAITTYKGLNYHNKLDRKLALKMTDELIHRVYGNRCLAIISLQADNSKHILHTHSIICARRYDTLKSISSRANWRATVKASNEILKAHGFTPITPTKHHHGYHLSRYRHSFIKHLKTQITKAKSNSSNLDDFRRNLFTNGIEFEPFKVNKINGSRRIKLYSKSTKDGHYKKLSNGKFVRLKRHFSYKFKFNDKTFLIRDKKLGYQFSPSYLLRDFKCNQALKNIIGKLTHKKLQHMPHFQPVIFHNNQPRFPKLRIFGGHSILYWLIHKSKNETEQEQRLLAKIYYNNSDNSIQETINDVLDNDSDNSNSLTSSSNQIQSKTFKDLSQEIGY